MIIPDAELVERFSRSSGPGGQGVNTADSRVELYWDIAASAALSEAQRARLLERLQPRLTNGGTPARKSGGPPANEGVAGGGGVLRIVASEQRSQRQNRSAARARLAWLVTDALAPPPPSRRPTRPSRAAKARRLDAKRRRGELKSGRGRPRLD